MKVLKSEVAQFAPKPNLAEWRASHVLPPEELISSCFGLIVYEDGLMFIRHNKRGPELPGGHKEVGESAEEAFRREISEECGVSQLENIQVIAHQIIHVICPKPENYGYPYPDSYQVLYCASTTVLDAFEANLDSEERFHVPFSEIKNHELYKKYGFLIDLVLP